MKITVSFISFLSLWNVCARATHSIIIKPGQEAFLHDHVGKNRNQQVNKNSQGTWIWLNQDQKVLTQLLWNLIIRPLCRRWPSIPDAKFLFYQMMWQSAFTTLKENPKAHLSNCFYCGKFIFETYFCVSPALSKNRRRSEDTPSYFLCPSDYKSLDA